MVAEVLVAQMQALLIQAEVAVVAQEVLVLPLVVQPLVTAANLATTHLTHKEAAELVTVANHQAVGLCTVQVAAVAEATGRAALLGQAQEVHGELILLALAGQLELSIQAI